MTTSENHRIFADGSHIIVKRKHKENEKKLIPYDPKRNTRYKKRSRARERLLSFKSTHFVTLTVQENSELRLNPKKLFKIGKNFLSSTGVTFTLILERYNDGGYHLHALTDGKINLTDWCELVNADINNCYCEKIYTNRLSCAYYLLKKIHLLPANIHHCYTNATNYKSEFTIVKNKETIFQNQQAALNADKMKDKETVILDGSIIELDSDDLNVKDSLATVNLTIINEETSEVQFRNYSFDEIRSKRNNKTSKYALRTQQIQAKNEKCHFSTIAIKYTLVSKYTNECFLRKKLARAPPKIKN
ncbi:hypothetical protein ACVR1I_03425 [Streptococcus cameli]